MKNRSRQVFTTVLFIPISFTVVFFLVQLLYKCLNEVLLSTLFIVAVICAWFLAKRFRIRWASQIALVIISVVALGIYSASQNCARCLGPGAEIKGSMTTVRNMAELYLNKNQLSYKAVCQHEDVLLLGESVKSKQIEVEQKCIGPLLKIIKPDFTANSFFNCNDSINSYAAEAYLPTPQNGTEFWCVDSTGFSGAIENSIGDVLSCQ